MNELIKQLVQHRGWEIITKMLKEEIIDAKKKINTDLPAEEIGKRYIAQQEASKIIERWLSKINRIANDSDLKEKKIYR